MEGKERGEREGRRTFIRREAVLVDQIRADERASPPESGFAVHCDGTCTRQRKGESALLLPHRDYYKNPARSTARRVSEGNAPRGRTGSATHLHP